MKSVTSYLSETVPYSLSVTCPYPKPLKSYFVKKLLRHNTSLFIIYNLLPCSTAIFLNISIFNIFCFSSGCFTIALIIGYSIFYL